MTFATPDPRKADCPITNTSHNAGSTQIDARVNGSAARQVETRMRFIRCDDRDVPVERVVTLYRARRAG